MRNSLGNRVSCCSVLKRKHKHLRCPKRIFLIISSADESHPPLTPHNEWALKTLCGSKFCTLMPSLPESVSPQQCFSSCLPALGKVLLPNIRTKEHSKDTP